MMADETITFEREAGGKLSEAWVLTRDTRHGFNGWRAQRYLPDGKGEMVWDESTMFFPSLAAAGAAFESGDLSAGRAAF